MPLTVKIDHKDFPKDTEFDVMGILIPNGKSVTLTEQEELAFVSKHEKAVKEALANSDTVEVTGTPKYSPTEVAKMFPEPEPEEAPVAPDTNEEDEG